MYELEGKDWKKPQYYSPCLIKMRGEFQASVFVQIWNKTKGKMGVELSPGHGKVAGCDGVKTLQTLL